MKMNVRLPHEGEVLDGLTTFDFTKLNAVNTCTRWGVIRYGKHLTSNANARAMALEAGSACHEVFSAVRLLDLLWYGNKLYPNYDTRGAVLQRAEVLFGSERAQQLISIAEDPGEDELTNALRAGNHILDTSGFYDDPGDKRRTVQRLAEAISAYITRYDFGKSVPYVNGSFVGIENAFDLVVEYTTDDGTVRKCRFYGRIDGVACYRNDPNNPIVEENKTASRLNDAWAMSFETSHQVTGYMVATATIIGQPVNRAKVIGLALPQPRSEYEGYQDIMVKRGGLQFEEWSKWFVLTAEEYFKYIEAPLDAPMMTGQCNRYFRPCSFIPLCAARDRETQKEYYDMLQVEEWSPLHEKASD